MLQVLSLNVSRIVSSSLALEVVCADKLSARTCWPGNRLDMQKLTCKTRPFESAGKVSSRGRLTLSEEDSKVKGKQGEVAMPADSLSCMNFSSAAYQRLG